MEIQAVTISVSDLVREPGVGLLGVSKCLTGKLIRSTERNHCGQE